MEAVKMCRLEIYNGTSNLSYILTARKKAGG
jgi:hypothetical protein